MTSIHRYPPSISNQLLDEIFKQVEELSIHPVLAEASIINSYSCLCEGQPDIQDIKGDILCVMCGILLERQNISDENESVLYGTGEEGGNANGQSRCSGFTDSLMGKSNLSTSMAGEGRMQNLLKWQTFDYSEIVMIQAKKTFSEAAQILRVPLKIVNQSCHYYKEAFNLKINGKKLVVRGINKSGILAVCFHTALTVNNESLPLHEIVKYFEIDNSVFNKSSKLLQQHLKKYFKTVTEDTNNEHLTRVCNKIGVPYKLQNISKTVFSACLKMRIFPEINKIILTACCIFFVITEVKCDIHVDLVAFHSKISKDTILKTSKILTENKIKIFNFIKQQ